MATQTILPSKSENIETPVDSAEAEAILAEMNRTARQMVQRLDRMNWLARSIARELRAARADHKLLCLTSH